MENESKRQKQVAKMIQQEIGVIFHKEGWSILKGALVTISHATMTPDLLLSRIYVSLSSDQHKIEIMDALKKNTKEIRYKLGNNLRHSLRRIPHLEFYYDDLLDESDRVTNIFNKLDIPDKTPGLDEYEEEID